MSPDIPLKIVEWFFQFGLIGFLLGMMVLYAIFRGWLYNALLSKQPQEHKALFKKVKKLIRSEHWGSLYQQFLKRILSKLTRVIGDHHRFPSELPDKPRLHADHPAIEQLHKLDTLRQVFGVNPFTVESYQFCFVFALLYPVLSFMLGWIVGGAGTLGSLELLPDGVPFWKRLGVILTLITSIVLVAWSRRLTGLSSLVTVVLAVIIAVYVIIFDGVVFGIAGITIGAIALTFAISGIVSIVVVVCVLSAVSVATSVAITFSFSLVFLSPFLLALYFLMYWLYNKAQKNNELAIYWFIYSLFFFTGCLAALNWVENTIAVMVLLFFSILPLVNTPLDWLSLGITRALLQSIRFNQHRFGKALLWGVLDLGLAVIALLLVSGVTVAVVSFANLIAIKPFIDLQVLFTSLGSLDNWRDNLWIYFMLLSTLIPTVVHFALAGGALTLAVSSKQRRSILEDIETNDLSAKKAWIYVSVMPAFGFVLAPTLLLFGLYWILHTHGALLGNALLSWVELLATWIDPTLGQLPKLIGA